MKIRAIAKNTVNGKETLITAFDAVYLREFNSKEFKNYKFYYTDKSGKYEMYPKFITAKNTAFFAFKSDGEHPENVIDEEGESLTHFAAKKALSNMTSLHLIDYRTKKEYYLNTIKNENCNEKRFDFDGRFFCDVYYKLDKSNQTADMKPYIYKWCEQLVIEVMVSHRTPSEKYYQFKNNNIPIFEIKIPKQTRDKFGLDICEEISKSRINRAISNMQKMFEKGIRGTFISDPSCQEFQLMSQYKEEIQKFENARNKKQIQYEEICEKTKSAKNELEEIEDKIKYYNSLEEKIKNLEIENSDLKSKLNKDNSVKAFIKKVFRK